MCHICWMLETSFCELNAQRIYWSAVSVDILQHLGEGVWREWPEKWYTGDEFLHHDGPTPFALSVRAFLANTGINVVLHPPYFPDQALCYFSLYQNSDWCWRVGRRFLTWSRFKNKCRIHVLISGWRTLANHFNSGRICCAHCITHSGTRQCRIVGKCCNHCERKYSPVTFWSHVIEEAWFPGMTLKLSIVADLQSCKCFVKCYIYVIKSL